MKPVAIRAFGIGGAVLAVAGVVSSDLAVLPRWAVTVIEGAALVLFIAFFMLHFETLKAFSAKRSTRLGINSVLMVLLFLGILQMFNILAYRHPYRIDLSETHQFTLVPQTLKVLQSLSEPVTIFAFPREGSRHETTYRDLLETYRYHSRYISYSVIDPDKNPSLARRYNVTRYETAIVERGAQTAEITAPTEQELTNGLIRATRQSAIPIRFVTGHGEPAFVDTGLAGYSRLKDALEKQGYDIAPISLLEQNRGTITGETVLVVAGPRRLFSPDELATVARHLDSGGRLCILLDPSLRSSVKTGLEDFLADWGIVMGSGVIMDPESRLSGAEPTVPIVMDFPEHEITRDFRNIAAFFKIARTVQFDAERATHAVQEWKAWPLARTNAASWEERGRESSDMNVAPDHNRKGPLTIAMALAPQPAIGHGGVPLARDPERRPALVVIGDSDFVSNANLEYSGNRDFFLNAIHWLAEEEGLISISPKSASFEPLMMTRNQARLMLYVQVLLIPGLVFGAGIVVWQRRRRL